MSFGVHWDRAARIPGVRWWMTSRLPEDMWFVGFDERTAILGDGEEWSVHGTGPVTVRGPAASASHRDGERFTTPSI